LRRRLGGATYAQIAADGGGILATVGATRAAGEEALVAATRGRLDDMLRCGTTTSEAKSGYGLDTATELKMLRVIATLARDHAIELSSTFMGAHDIAPEYQGRRREFVALIVEEMIPSVACERLAEWCDVFCDTGAFTPDEAREILAAAGGAGMKLRIHADELERSGGSRVAADLRVRSADHLVFAS
jgi:imidazolonepropionase